jgi:hypothetical protein
MMTMMTAGAPSAMMALTLGLLCCSTSNDQRRRLSGYAQPRPKTAYGHMSCNQQSEVHLVRRGFS